MSDKYRIAWGDPAFVFRPNGSGRRVSAVRELNRLLARIERLEAEVKRLRSLPTNCLTFKGSKAVDKWAKANR